MFSELRQGGRSSATAKGAGDCIGIRDVGKTKTPARGILRAQNFDDLGMSQGGQLCQTIFAALIWPLRARGKWRKEGGFPGWLNWLDFGLGGFLTKPLKNPP
jgi:hypothetical protein